MNKAIQDNTELQDEELYALLDKAFETERLCVSEDLIQKTLKRVAEEPDGKVISFAKAAKRRTLVLRYTGVAAAALFVLVLGGQILGGRLWNGGVQKEATGDMSQRNGQRDASAGETEDGLSIWADSETYYTNSADSVCESADDALSDRAGVACEATISDVKDAGLQSTEVAMPERLSVALSGNGYETLTSVAEIWEFVEGWEDWDKELEKLLKTEKWPVKGLPEKGSYNYSLMLWDGMEKTICTEEPLEFVVRIETEQGALWGLFGATINIYSE